MNNSKLTNALTNLKYARMERHILCGGATAHQEACRLFNRARRQDAKAVIAECLAEYAEDASRTVLDEMLAKQDAETERWLEEDEWLDWRVYNGEAEYPVDTWDDEDYWDDFSPRTNICDAFDAMEDIQREQRDYEWYDMEEQYYSDQSNLASALAGEWQKELNNPSINEEATVRLPTLQEWHNRKVA